MEFERNEIETILLCLRERVIQLNNFITEWEKATWENIGNMQGMYADKEGFENHKEILIKNWQNEIVEIENLQEKIEEGSI